MNIKYEKKMQDLSAVCKNVDDFIKILNDKRRNDKPWLNFNNPLIYKKMNDFFIYCLNWEKNFNLETLNQDIISFFKLKNGFKTSKESYIERGYSENEVLNILNEQNNIRNKKVSERKNSLFQQRKEYIFGHTKFHLENEPVCNLCGSNFEYVLLLDGTKKILGCTNSSCDGYKEKGATNKKHEAVLPEEEYKRFLNKQKLSKVLNLEYWLKCGYNEEEAVEKIREIQSERSKKKVVHPSYRKEYFIKKYGDEEGNKKLKERSCFCQEFWIKRGYTEEDAKEKIHEIQTKNANRVKTHITCRHKEHWIKRGYSEDEAIKKVKEVQSTFSKEKCIEKYGEVEGLKKWQESLHKSKKLHVGYSVISQELFDILLENIENKDYIFYGSKNHEYSIREENTNYIYDFTDLDKRKIIEFQGDVYHGNPELYNETDKPNPFKKDKTCKELWEFDKKKSNIAIKNNFKILCVWEKEYRENKQETINKCIKFLKDEE